MFQHAYGGYLRHAFPRDELRPRSCTGHVREENNVILL